MIQQFNIKKKWRLASPNGRKAGKRERKKDGGREGRKGDRG